MATTTPVSLHHHFADSDRPPRRPLPPARTARHHRHRHLCRHRRRRVLDGVEAYGHAKHDWLARFFRLPNGIPSHDTFRRVFCLLDPEAFQRCFAAWIAALADAAWGPDAPSPSTARRHAAADAAGKGWRRLHLVSAWAGANHLSLGQVAVDDKSNEITAIPRLLELLDLSGALVTIDAMGCQKEIAAKIVQGGGDYVLAVKDNQPHLLEDIHALHGGVGDRLRGPGV